MKNTILFVFISIAIHCKAQEYIPLPRDFENNVYTHIKNLSGFGVRAAETEAEKKTVTYIKHEFESIGLKTQLDTFKYKSYIIKNERVKIGDKTYPFEKISNNPYSKAEDIKAKAYFFHPDASYDSLPDLTKNVIVTKESAVFWKLENKNPLSIVFLNDTIFEEVKNLENIDIELNDIGIIKEFTTYNILASINSKAQKEIVISSHWDSYCGPGATDNASGVGVMIELARYFYENCSEIPVNLKFVAFGAEEQGMLGSKSYIEKYRDTLRNCLFNFNIDMVGESGEAFIALEGVEKSEPENDLSFNYLAKCDFEGKWIASGHEFHINKPTLIPSWLSSSIKNTGQELNIKITPVGGMGSDHRIFAYIGVPSTNMCIVDINAEESRHHTIHDVIEYIDMTSLRKAGLIVTNTVLNMF